MKNAHTYRIYPRIYSRFSVSFGIYFECSCRVFYLCCHHHFVVFRFCFYFLFLYTTCGVVPTWCVFLQNF
jgi:hypothetical protein